MLTRAPFLTGFPTLLFGRAKRSTQEQLRLERAQLLEQSPGAISAQLADEISPELVARHAHDERRRVYPQQLTFWAFLSQILSEDGSCAWAVAQVQQWMRQKGLPVPSANTASYCEARQALPEAMLESIHHELISQLEGHLCEDDLWRGHRVKAVDATSVQAPDTAANQEQYPQPSTQAPGCGFPVVQLVALIDLVHGGWEDFAQSNIETGELRGFDQLEPLLKANDVLVADRLYSSYELIARMIQRDVEFIGRHHQSRKLDFRRGKKLGPDERLQTWKRPRRQPAGSRLSAEEWRALPEEINLRVIRYRGPGRDGKARVRYAITPLLDSTKYPASEVVSLYFHRWEIELRFRDIKTTMGMEMLRTRSPGMLRKEIMMHAIAYNVIRLLMLKSARAHGVNHRRLSFQGALQVLERCAAGFEGTLETPLKRRCQREDLLERIAERPIPDRPGRNEPRRPKRRPKNTNWLQQPRRDYPEHFYCEDHPRKILDEAA